MTPEQMRAWVRASRAAQGLPPSIEDPGTVQKTIEQVATVVARRLLRERHGAGEPDAA